MMKKIFLTTILGSVLIFGVFGGRLQVSADIVDTILDKLPTPDAPENPSPGAQNKSCSLDKNGQEICKLENPLKGDKKEVSQIISTVIKAVLGIIGAITLLMLVWGGFQWLTSAGNEEKIKMGTQTMVWAIIGVVLVFASYILLATFTNYLTGNT